MDASEIKPHFTKELNEKSSKMQNKYSKRNMKKNLMQSQKKQLNKFDNIEYIGNYIEISKYQKSFIINNNNSDHEKRSESIEKNSTTNSSSSQNGNNTPKENNNYILNNNNIDNNKNLFPIYNYYEETNNFLKQNLNNFNYTKTSNFISKELYFNIIYQNHINILYYSNDYSIKNNIEENNKDKIFPFYYNNNYNSKVIRGIQNPNLFFNINSINNISKNKNENTNQKNIYFNKGKKGKHFIERNGDWICSSCKNLNFAFRIICNRCNLLKDNPEKNRKEKDYYSNENKCKYSNSKKENNYININKKKI